MTKKTSKHNITGTDKRPRVCIFRSNNAIYAQAIDDAAGKTIASANSLTIKEEKTPVEKAFIVGENLAKALASAKLSEIVFDRNVYRYHGRVKAAAEGIRKGGIKF